MVTNFIYLLIAQLALVWLWVIFKKYKTAKKDVQQHEKKSTEYKTLPVVVIKEDHTNDSVPDVDEDHSPLPPEQTHKELAAIEDKKNSDTWRLLLKQDTNKFFEELFRRTEEQNFCGNFFDTTCGGQVTKIAKGLRCANTQSIFDYLCQIGWGRYYRNSPNTNWCDYLRLLFGKLSESQQAEVLLKWEDEIMTSEEVSILTFLWFVSSKFMGYGGPSELQSHYANRYRDVDADVIFNYLLPIGLEVLGHRSQISSQLYICRLFQRLPESQQAEVLLKWEDDVINDESAEISQFLHFVRYYMLSYYETNNLTRFYRLRFSTADWEAGFKQLVAYKEELGDRWVSQSFNYNHPTLGAWVQRQRLEKEQLTPEQLDRLNELGFVWDPSNAQWEQGCKHLVAYTEEFGDCLVPIRFIANDYHLGGWVNKQRLKKEQLTPERLERLNELGFVWKTR